MKEDTFVLCCVICMPSIIENGNFDTAPCNKPGVIVFVCQRDPKSHADPTLRGGGWGCRTEDTCTIGSPKSDTTRPRFTASGGGIEALPPACGAPVSPHNPIRPPNATFASDALGINHSAVTYLSGGHSRTKSPIWFQK